MALGMLITVLAGLNLLSLSLTHGFDQPGWGRDLIDLNREGSLGTWLSGLLLATLAVMCVACAAQDAQAGGCWRRNWLLLALALLHVSMDELLAIHERVSAAVQQSLGTDGTFYFAWTIPASGLILAFAGVQARFLLHLTPLVRNQMLVAAAIFLTGALGLELVESAAFVLSAQEQSLLFNSLSAVEEHGADGDRTHHDRPAAPVPARPPRRAAGRRRSQLEQPCPVICSCAAVAHDGAGRGSGPPHNPRRVTGRGVRRTLAPTPCPP